MTKKILLISSVIFSFSFFFSLNVVKAQKISQMHTAGNVTITMKVLPAEQFKGTDAEMKWDSGATPDYLQGSSKPNHHLVAFIKKDGQPVDNASVTISYRELSPKKTDWTSLPVAKMHVSGKGSETTHYGNNLWLAKGDYEARITVKGNPPSVFNFTLTQ